MNKLHLIDYVLIVEVVIIVIGLGYLLTRPPTPCYQSLDITPGQNFNQPILTKHNCALGEIPTN